MNFPKTGNINMGEIGVWIAGLSCIGTLALLIINLKVSGAMSEMKTSQESARTEFMVQISDTRLKVEEMRGDFFKEHTKLYSQIIQTSTTTFMNRDLSMQMHQENVKRADDIKELVDQRTTDLGKRIDDLTTRVGDIS